MCSLLYSVTCVYAVSSNPLPPPPPNFSFWFCGYNFHYAHSYCEVHCARCCWCTIDISIIITIIIIIKQAKSKQRGVIVIPTRCSKSITIPTISFTYDNFKPTWHLNDHKQIWKWKNAEQILDAKFTLGVDTIRPKSSRIKQGNICIGGCQHDVSDKVSCKRRPMSSRLIFIRHRKVEFWRKQSRMEN